MNGRIYDFNVGRFLSVDPFLQFPENSQSANPYSYILNNPMSGTDPTGYAATGGSCSTGSNTGFEGFCTSVQLADTESKKKNKAKVDNGQKNELQTVQTDGTAKQEKKIVGLQLNTDKKSLSYGNDSNFIKGYDSVEGDMSGILSMAGPALAVDAVKAGIDTVNAIADEYEQSGLSMATVIVAGKAAGEAAIDVGAKKFRLPGVSKSTNKAEHANKIDGRPATLYEKYDKDGNFLKHGITKHENPAKRYTSKQINGGTVVRTDRGPRNEIIKKERDFVERNPGPDNHERWAGKRLGE